ncbi:MAG: phospholipase D family protein [Bacillus sp. (in: firmicutes)]
MLKPAEDRLNYSDLLIPPGGFELEFAIGTTYSLDLEALIGIPLSLSLSEEIDETLTSNPLYMLEGLRKSKDKFAIFCEAGQIKVPQKGNFIFSQLENNVFEVALQNEKSFHPKVWLIKYKNAEGDTYFRLLVLSRNLTFDRSWDMAVCLEGKKNNRKTRKNRPLSDFLSFLLRFANQDSKTKKMKKLIEELDYVHFKTDDKHFPDFDFHPIGIEGYGKEETELFQTYHHLMIFSPFLSKSTIEELNSLSLMHATKTLITRKAELAKLNQSLFEDFRVYVLKDFIIEGESSVSGDTEQLTMAKLQDIHAKMYVRTKYSQHHMYIGSANCSNNAFNGNVEFLLKLQYQKHGFRISQLLKELFGEDEMENPFEEITELPVFEEVDDRISDQLEKAIKQLCRTEFDAEVTQKSGIYQARVEFDEIPRDVEWMIAPLLSKREQRLEHCTIFENLSLIELGEFYKVKASKQDHTIERIIKIPTRGIPEERDSEVYQLIIRDKQTFLQYVSFLLSDDYLLSAIEAMDYKAKTSGVMPHRREVNQPAIYESLLKATAESPNKLKDIRQIMEMIKDKEIIPEDFESVYSIFFEVAKKVKRR